MMLVTGAVAALALVALAVLLGWACGSLVARMVGMLLMFDSLLNLSTAWLNPARVVPGLLWLVLGSAVWMLGHRIYLAKYGRWRSIAAARMFSTPGLRVLIPIRARV